MKYDIQIEVNLAASTDPASITSEVTAAIQQAVERVPGVVGMTVSYVGGSDLPPEEPVGE